MQQILTVRRGIGIVFGKDVLLNLNTARTVIFHLMVVIMVVSITIVVVMKICMRFQRPITRLDPVYDSVAVRTAASGTHNE